MRNVGKSDLYCNSGCNQPRVFPAMYDGDYRCRGCGHHYRVPPDLTYAQLRLAFSRKL